MLVLTVNFFTQWRHSMVRYLVTEVVQSESVDFNVTNQHLKYVSLTVITQGLPTAHTSKMLVQNAWFSQIVKHCVN